MPVATNVRQLDLAEGLEHLAAGGAALIDLRPVGDYLESHIPGSLALVYEFGPGLPGRARDCLPLDLRLLLIDPGELDIGNAAAALRGKGFTVIGSIAGALEGWPGGSGGVGGLDRRPPGEDGGSGGVGGLDRRPPGEHGGSGGVGGLDRRPPGEDGRGGALESTQILGPDDSPAGTVLHVGDPGAAVPEGAHYIPIERFYGRAGELEGVSPVTIVAGRGVRAALAVGILEQHGVEEVRFWWTRA